MGERRVEARTSFKRELEPAAAPPGKMGAPPTCGAPKRPAAPPATQTRGDGSRGFGARGEAAVLHNKPAIAGSSRDSSQNVTCGKSDAPAASAMNRARSDSLVRRTGPAASFKKTVSIKDSKTSSCHAVAGADACTPKASPGENPEPSSGACASGRIKSASSQAVAGADACVPKAPPGTKPEPSSGASAIGRTENRKRACIPLFEEPWTPPLHKKTKLEPPFSPRRAVQERLRVFREEAMEQQRRGETKPDLKALNVLKQRGGGVPSMKFLGEVPGVEVGDEFNYRSEIMVAGLHGSPFCGIDSMASNGMMVATCVISSRRYDNVMEGSDVLEYCGEGGPGCWDSGGGGSKEPAGDQTLDRGNLALKNSMDAQTPVRVVHGFEVPRGGGETLESRAKTAVKYVYDGLYRVVDFWWETAATGFRVYKFQMRRIPGQPQLELKEVRRRRSSGEAAGERHGRCKKAQ